VVDPVWNRGSSEQKHNEDEMNHKGQRKKHFTILLALALILLGLPGFARAHDDSKPVVPIMTVTGTGNLAIAPDMAYVTFGIQTVGRLLAEARR
jgi:uncharacterized protein YggE